MSLMFAFSLVAAACGGSDSAGGTSDDEGGETEASSEEEQEAGGIDGDAAEEALDAADEEVVDEGEGDGEAMADPQNIEELEAFWAENRQAVIDDIVANGYGVDDANVLIGPAGFEIDLNSCPADWSDVGGVGDTLKIGHTTALSGNLAAYGNIAFGMEAYFDYVNENGGVGGVDLELITKDDAYVATQTIELVDELLQSEDPFAIITLGSPNTLAVYDTLNEKCVPHPFVMTGHPAWGDPVEHPWTNGLQMSYATEAILWGSWIKANMADQLPVTVAGLVMDNDFGLAYEDGMQTYADANPDVVEEFIAVRHDPAAPTVTNEMTTIAAASPDVFISMTAGNPCLLAVEEAGRAGLTGGDTVLFAPSVCKDPNAYMIPAGESADGWYIVGGGIKASTDPQYADDPYISWMNDELAARDFDITVGLYATGFGQYGWPVVEALRIAAELEGGLTRTNLSLAVRAMDVIHPATLDGISFAMNGAEDGFPIEGSDIAIYDAANESWIQEGAIIDLNGSSPNCSWGDTGC
jgi:branched-chain amino acid transport system substrate-binding protein